jgi:D-glycero-D-manno-heptose 1,7-bisphosphate phosphatase
MPRVETAFLDRDGVVNSSPPEGDYIRTWEQFRFLPRAIDALRLLTAAGVRVIVATNQRGVARGLMSEDELLGIHARMLEALEREGARIDAIYYCPHEKGECSCRKPDVGLFLRARKDFPEIDFAKSAMVGDSLSDMEAGQRLGCRNILVPNPHREIDETVREAAARGLRIHEVAGSLFDAVSRLILDDAQER